MVLRLSFQVTDWKKFVSITTRNVLKETFGPTHARTHSVTHCFKSCQA